MAASRPTRTLTPVTGTLGPHRVQQRNMAPHHIPLDRQGRFFYVPCKGSDCVVAYRLDEKRRVLVEAARVTARPRPRRATSTSIPGRRWPTSSTSSIRRSRPIARIAAAASSRRCRPCPPRRPTSPATAPARRSGSIAPAATSMSPIAATTASACSPSIPPKARWRRSNGCRPRAARRASSPSIPPRSFSTSPTRTDTRSSPTSVGRDGRLAPSPVRVKVGSPACIVFSR